jgi:uncharacterized membrane protein YccC
LFALSASIALVTARSLHIDLGGLWVVLSSMSMLKPRLSDSLEIARDQLLGTTAGVTFGALLGWLHQATLSVTLAVFLTAVVCRSVTMLRSITNIACVAAAIVILLPNGNPSYVTAWNRWCDTLLGGAIAVLVVALAALGSRWWPVTEPA